MRPRSGPVERSVTFFLSCLVAIVVHDAGGSDGDWGCFAYGFLSGSAVSGIVPFVMAVEAFAASLQVLGWWHDIVPGWVASYDRLLRKILAAQRRWAVVVILPSHDD